MWVKPTSEMSFLYGNHLLKSGLGRITENTPANQGVVVFSMSDVPLGFGVAAKSTQDCRKLDASSIVDSNFAVGSIFAVWQAPSLLNVTGRELIAAGLLEPADGGAVRLAPEQELHHEMRAAQMFIEVVPPASHVLR